MAERDAVYWLQLIRSYAGPERAKAFAMEFPFDVKAVFPIGVDVRVARGRRLRLRILLLAARALVVIFF